MPKRSLLLCLATLTACSPMSSDSLASPSYVNTSSWAAYPGVVSAADGPYPIGSYLFEDGQETALVDTFYIYPTLYSGENPLNAPIPNSEVNAGLAQYLPLQVGIFNGSTLIYAPYYRQASVMAYFGSAATLENAIDLAYEDVAAAFAYYIATLNHGRPFVIVSHSQGSAMAIRLITRQIDNTPIADRLVAAYIVGEVIGNQQFQTIPPCTSPTQIGCFVTWASVLTGATPQLLTGEGNAIGTPVCVNPITWKMDGVLATKSQHRGGIPEAFNRVDEQMISAQCQNGLLRISNPKSGYANESGDYHESDFNLFYLDIRENINQRITAYQNAK